ncbi:hypothetical protein [Thiomicrorhabdus sp. Milos-T2]|nr:hypothetical protein [Thiomicrorhabdus sp. Milos-T2]
MLVSINEEKAWQPVSELDLFASLISGEKLAVFVPNHATIGLLIA